MIDIEIIRNTPDAVRKALRDRNMNEALVDDFLAVDGEWRKLTAESESARAELNRLSKDRKIEEAKIAKARVKDLESGIGSLEKRRDEFVVRFPNIPAADVPVGKDETENVVLRTWGTPRKDKVTDYLTLAEKFDLIDVARAGKVAGSRFGYLKNEAAILEFALVRFVIDCARAEGFVPVIPPVLVKPEMLVGMGKVKFIDDKDAFYLPDDKLFLAGSAEHTIGPMHSGEIFEEADLPRRYVAFSTCFRREAGSYGKDTKGILRVHQFDKVELFSFSKPDDSVQEHDFLVSIQEKVMQSLELPHQVMQICTGDMGFGDRKQIDINVWLPSEGRYRETHSASNTGDYQARGVSIKYKPKTQAGKSKTEFVHMLNATGITMRALIAILENHQQPDGSVKVPEVLVKYTGFSEIKR
jgi:seryl-tRNA synthetase